MFSKSFYEVIFSFTRIINNYLDNLTESFSKFYNILFTKCLFSYVAVAQVFSWISKKKIFLDLINTCLIVRCAILLTEKPIKKDHIDQQWSTQYGVQVLYLLNDARVVKYAQLIQECPIPLSLSV